MNTPSKRSAPKKIARATGSQPTPAKPAVKRTVPQNGAPTNKATPTRRAPARSKELEATVKAGEQMLAATSELIRRLEHASETFGAAIARLRATETD